MLSEIKVNSSNLFKRVTFFLLAQTGNNVQLSFWYAEGLSKAIARLATPVRAPQRLWKASTRLLTSVRAPQRLSKASTRLATPVRAPQ